MQDRFITVLAAIADPTRRAILEQLARGPARVTDVAAPFAISLNAVSKHIKVLEHARLVRRTRSGREHTLSLKAEPLRDVMRWDLAVRAVLDRAPRPARGALRQAAGEVTKLIDVTVSRTIPASPQEVFDVWLDPKSPGGLWFGVQRVILTPVVDGLFYDAVEHEGRLWPHYGPFITLDRGRTIEHTWVSEATKGLETVVHVALEPRDGKTHVTLRHTSVRDDEKGRQHRQHKDGWDWVLSMTAQRFEASTRATTAAT